MAPVKVERRALLLLGAVAISFGGVAYRYWYLQVERASYYQAQARQDYLRKLPIPAPRGNIVTANGVTVATSKPSWTLYYLNQGGPMPSAEVAQLSQYLGVPTKIITHQVQKGLKTLPAYQPISITAGLSPQQMTAIEENIGSLPNIRIQPVAVRSYPYGSVMGNIIGFVSQINSAQYQKLQSQGYSMTSIVGTTGLEAFYQKYLRGHAGGQYAEVNRQGRLVRLYGQAVPVPGDTLHLTVNWRLETAAQNALAYVTRTMRHSPNPVAHSTAATSGGVIALNPQNGDVLALASYPSYNPNQLIPNNPAVRSQYYNKIIQPPYPLFIRPIQGLYSPGSVFKPLMAVAALASHTITATAKIFDPGYFPKDPAFHNWWRPGFGWLNIEQAIGLSDDTFFYTLGYDMGIHTMDQWFQNFLLNHRTGIDLPGESRSNIPTPARFQAITHTPWTWGDNLNTVIGQGISQYTLVALARAEAAIANGGTLYQPHLVSSITTSSGKLVKAFPPVVQGHVPAPASVFHVVHKGMELSAQSSNINHTGMGGTGYGALRGFPYPLASKTGTAQLSGKANNAFFVTYGPMPHPTILVMVYVHAGNWGANSGFVARAILDQYFKTADPTAQSVFDGAFGGKFAWPFGYKPQPKLGP